MRDNDTPMPGSNLGGQGEMGAPLEDGPNFVPTDTEGNVTGAGTNDMLDTGSDDLGGGTTGAGTGGYGGGYGGGGPREGGGAESYGTDSEGGQASAER